MAKPARTIDIDFRRDSSDVVGWYDDLGRRVVLNPDNPQIQKAMDSRSSLVAIARQLSSESGPHDFCYGHKFCMRKMPLAIKR